jgi:stage II sporulation protein D
LSVSSKDDEAGMSTQQADNPNAATRAGLALLLALLVAAASIAPASAAAKTRFRVSGGGWGHGVGLSAYGAYGYAKHGRDYRDIAKHYFKGTKIGKVKRGRSVRVLLGTAGSLPFSGSRRACGRDLKPSGTYRAQLGGKSVRLQSKGGQTLARCGKTLDARGSKGAIRIGGFGSYRGDLVAAASGGTLYVINRVSLEGYIRGVLPNELPASWPMDALKSLAVTARALAVTSDKGALFDVYDDTRSQVYGGYGSESKRTNRAAKETARQVVTYEGKPIVGYYSSTSGGRTENIEYAFPGASPVPYLKSVKDPYDDTSPYHRWRVTFSRGEMQAKLGDLVKGRFQGIKVTKRGVSPRVVRAKVLGSGGSTKVTGTDLQVRLGLRSTWMKFKKLG